MKTTAIALALVLLAGCSPLMTADELRMEPAHRYVLVTPIPDATECVRNTAESISGFYHADIRGNEVRIRFSDSLNGVVTLAPAVSGSLAEVHVPPGFLRDPAMFVKGC
jgi:hypothetical protein